jgi:hypothetical protein
MTTPLSKSDTKALESASRSNKPTLKRLIAFCWDDCPTASLAKAQRSNDWAERAAIARHPKTPESALKNLVGDTHPVVRALAKQNLSERSQ